MDFFFFFFHRFLVLLGMQIQNLQLLFGNFYNKEKKKIIFLDK